MDKSVRCHLNQLIGLILPVIKHMNIMFTLLGTRRCMHFQSGLVILNHTSVHWTGRTAELQSPSDLSPPCFTVLFKAEWLLGNFAAADQSLPVFVEMKLCLTSSQR